jgi:hypothetical protein
VVGNLKQQPGDQLVELRSWWDSGKDNQLRQPDFVGLCRSDQFGTGILPERSNRLPRGGHLQH